MVTVLRIKQLLLPSRENPPHNMLCIGIMVDKDKAMRYGISELSKGTMSS